MTDIHKLRIAFGVSKENAIVQAEKTHDKLSAVITDITDFLAQFGYPDDGPQTITIVITSERTP